MEGSRAGKDFFSLFSYPLITGSKSASLSEMNGIAISRKMADLFFGSPQNAMGKTIRYENKLNFFVSGVFENVPAQSSIKFDFLFNWQAQQKLMEWASNDFRTYIQLNAGADVKVVEAKINRFLASRLNTTKSVKTYIGLQKFGDNYLHSNFVNGKPTDGKIEYVQIFSGVAIFILLIACINFMNLATARSSKRAKEVGLRKVVGSSRANLMGQFYGETMLFSLLAMLFSILLLCIFLPSFNHYTGKNISLPFTQASFWLSLTGTAFITGICAGSYPALYLSSLKPVLIIKGVIQFTQGAVWFRKGLTVFQFILSIILLIATIVISQQTRYVQNSNLGYDKGNLFYTRIEGELTNRNKYLLFKQRLSAMPGIDVVDRSTEAPHNMGFEVVDAINWQGKEKNSAVGFKPTSVGFDFLKLMKLKIIEGRDFSGLNPTDSADAFMVNEEAVRQMGIKNPIGKWVSAWKKRGHIIAVLKDFHSNSFREPIKPIVVDVKEYENFGVVIVRARPGKTKQALASMENIYKDMNPNYPFSYQFVDEEYRKLYNNEQVTAKLSISFSVLAMLISCMGLLGLAIFSTEQRVKEIGIRKVLGASVTQISALLSLDFMRLVLLAIIIASPIAYLLMEKWLQSFAYHTTLHWWVFALAALLTFAIALITVSFKAVKAAMANPVKSLKVE